MEAKVRVGPQGHRKKKLIKLATYIWNISNMVNINRYQHLLNYSMVQSSSWEANWFAASQEITRISRNPKAHLRIHKRPPPVQHYQQ